MDFTLKVQDAAEKVPTNSLQVKYVISTATNDQNKLKIEVLKAGIGLSFCFQKRRYKMFISLKKKKKTDL